MDRKTRTNKINSLKSEGFRMVKGYEHLYINRKGEVFNLKTDAIILPNSRYLRLDNQYLSLPKLVLEAFTGQKCRSGQIVFVDGNKMNFEPENIRYARIFNERDISLNINPDNLLTAIRCFFSVEKKFKVKNYTVVKFYLSIIAEKSGYMQDNYKDKNLVYFSEYLNQPGKSMAEIAKGNGLSIRDCNYIIKDHINKLINTVLAKIEKGEVSILPYSPTKREQKQKLFENYLSLLTSTGKELTPQQIKETKELIFSSKETKEKRLIQKFIKS